LLNSGLKQAMHHFFFEIFGADDASSIPLNLKKKGPALRPCTLPIVLYIYIYILFNKFYVCLFLLQILSVFLL
jgi:hypothetical protein